MLQRSRAVRFSRRLYRRLRRYRDYIFAQQQHLSLLASLDTWHGDSRKVRMRERISTLWRGLRTFRKHLFQPLYDPAHRAAFESADNVVVHARRLVTESFNYSGEGFFIDPNGESAACNFAVTWNAADGVSGWHRTSATTRTIKEISPGQIQENGSSAKSLDGSLTIEGISPAVWPVMQDPFAVRWDAAARLTVTRSSNYPIATTRYLYRGALIRGLREPTFRRCLDDAGELEYRQARDSLEAKAFQRRARVTQVPRSPTESIVAVTLTGAPLEESEQEALWNTICFLAGGRTQPITVECMDSNGAIVETRCITGVPAGPADYPPFGPYESDASISPYAFETLCDGMQQRRFDGYPIGTALHHLHDANSGYYLVDLRNTLLSIHTLFEAWADIYHLRRIVSDGAYRKYRKPLQELAADGIDDLELKQKVHEAVQFGNKRTAEDFEVAFPAFLNVQLSDVSYSGLKRRNELVHKGWVPHTSQEIQRLLNERRATRSVANAMIARLCGYQGPLFDYESFDYSTF